MRIPSQAEVSKYCLGAAEKFILGPGLPLTKDAPNFPLIVPTSTIGYDVIEYFTSATEEGREVEIICGPDIKPKIKRAKLEDSEPPCEYCGISHSVDGRCHSCGAPSKCPNHTDPPVHILKMPRYDFDPVMGYVERIRFREYQCAQFEVLCLCHDNPANRKSLMFARVAQFINVHCY